MAQATWANSAEKALADIDSEIASAMRLVEEAIRSNDSNEALDAILGPLQSCQSEIDGVITKCTADTPQSVF